MRAERRRPTADERLAHLEAALRSGRLTVRSEERVERAADRLERRLDRDACGIVFNSENKQRAPS